MTVAAAAIAVVAGPAADEKSLLAASKLEDVALVAKGTLSLGITEVSVAKTSSSA